MLDVIQPPDHLLPPGSIIPRTAGGAPANVPPPEAPLSCCRPRQTRLFITAAGFSLCPATLYTAHIRPGRTRWGLIEPARSRTTTGSRVLHIILVQTERWDIERRRDSSLTDRGTGSTSAPADDAPAKRFRSGRQNPGRRFRKAISGGRAGWCHDLLAASRWAGCAGGKSSTVMTRTVPCARRVRTAAAGRR